MVCEGSRGWKRGWQNQMGARYASGRGVEQAEEKALQWWTKAEEQGYAAARYMLIGSGEELAARDTSEKEPSVILDTTEGKE